MFDRFLSTLVYLLFTLAKGYFKVGKLTNDEDTYGR